MSTDPRNRNDTNSLYVESNPHSSLLAKDLCVLLQSSSDSSHDEDERGDFQNAENVKNDMSWSEDEKLLPMKKEDSSDNEDIWESPDDFHDNSETQFHDDDYSKLNDEDNIELQPHDGDDLELQLLVNNDETTEMQIQEEDNIGIQSQNENNSMLLQNVEPNTRIDRRSKRALGKSIISTGIDLGMYCGVN